jgi:ABC-2 type transport system ATP-binding protein
MTGGVAVELAGVTRRFGRTTAIEDVSFDIRPGEVLGLLGPNGAGKTTTMRVLTGFLRPDAGTVRVVTRDGDGGGADPATEPDVRRLVGYVPEAGALYADMAVGAYLLHCARLRRVPRRHRWQAIRRAAHQAGVDGVLGQRVGTLSRGFRQRVALAQALVHDPRVLVLDEPTTGLDPRQVVEARQLIARLGRKRTVLLSSHLLSEVTQLCKRVVVLDRGRVVKVGDVAALTEGASLETAYLRLVQG